MSLNDSYKEPIIKNDLNSIATFLKISGMLLVFIGAVSFFIYETKGLPPRVAKLEQDFANTKKELSEKINNLNTQLSKNDVKTDLILDDVRTIRAYIMNKEKGK